MLNRSLISIICLLVIVGGGIISAAEKQRPHIIFIEVDDLTYTYTSVFGNSTAKTPRLQELANHSYIFKNAMCQGTMCGPSRNCLITGKYPHQLGFYQNGQLKKLPEESWSLSLALKKSGYYTAWIGKSHLKPYFTKKQGETFKSFFGFDYAVHTLGRVMLGSEDAEEGKEGELNPYSEYLKKKGLLDKFQADAEAKRNTSLDEADYLDGWFTGLTQEFVRGYQTEQPLFLWVNYSVPHGPYDVPDIYHLPFKELSMPGISKALNFSHPESLIQRTKTFKTEKLAIESQRGYHASIVFMDKQLGIMIDVLKEKKLWDNSWIIFFSDHGIMQGVQGLVHKNTLFRPVTNPTLVIHPPGGLNQMKEITEPVELMDLLPTFMEVAKISDDKAPAGVSLNAVFKGAKSARKYTFAEIEKWIVACDGRYRLIQSTQNEGELLFDDERDPENLQNIADKEPTRVEELSLAIKNWLQETGERKAARTY